MNTTCYEDGLIRAELILPGANKGHLFVCPKEDYSSLEELDNTLRDHLFFTSSYVATLLFELVKAHGTNIILNEVEKPFGVHIIARYQDDGLNFLWEPKPGDQQKLVDIGKKIKDAADEIAWSQDNTKEGKSKTNALVQKKDESVPSNNSKIVLDPDDPDQKDNHLLDTFRRVP
ncbi:MAG: HIT family protein [Candidatus Nanoarchaeia archaeon]